MGSRGCGKSTLGQNIQEAYPKKVIFDTLCEYPSDEPNVVSNFYDFADRLEQFEKTNENFKLIYQFDPESDISDLEFNEAMRLCYYFGNIQIVLEEVQVHCGVHGMPKWLKNCLLTGRHRNISVLCTTQRPGELHKTILSQCQHIFVGQLIEPNDQRYVAPILGESVEKLGTLPKGRFIYKGPHGISEVESQI